MIRQRKRGYWASHSDRSWIPLAIRSQNLKLEDGWIEYIMLYTWTCDSSVTLYYKDVHWRCFSRILCLKNSQTSFHVAMTEGHSSESVKEYLHTLKHVRCQRRRPRRLLPLRHSKRSSWVCETAMSNRCQLLYHNSRILKRVTSDMVPLLDCYMEYAANYCHSGIDCNTSIQPAFRLKILYNIYRGLEHGTTRWS